MIDYGYCQSELCWGTAKPVTPMTTDIMTKVCQGIQAVGGSRVRIGIQVGTWADLDSAINIACQYGLKPLLCNLGNPTLGYTGTPASYGALCKAVALRYGPAGTNQVSEYEIFNEQNSAFNPPQNSSAAAFLDYLKAGYTAIKSVHTSSTVICGGTVPTTMVWFGWAVDPLQWYTDLYAAGGKNYFDAAGFHLYADMVPSPTMRQWKYMTDIRALMVAQGDSAKKIWVTEVGTSNPGPGISDAITERDWLKLMVDGIMSYPWCGPFFIYNFHDSDNNLSDSSVDNYGIVDFNFVPKQPKYGYAATIHGTGTADTTPPATVTGLTFTDVGSTTAMLTWNPSTDDVAVFNYRVYLNGAMVLQTAATAATLHLTPASPYSVYVTAVDAAGNESTPSAASSFTSNAPSGGGLQAFYQYTFTGTGSTLPTTLVQLGLGYTVASDVALPNPSGVDGAFWTIAPYSLNQQSPNHASEIVQATASAYPDRAAMALVRATADGTQWVGAWITGGGQADACQILTCSGGVVTLRNACNAPPLLPGERLRLSVDGNVYTVTRITTSGISADLLVWTDLNGAYTGANNQRAGMGWRHKRVGSVNYPPPGITGQWKASDLMGVHPTSGSADSWMLALVDDADWPELIATGSWQSLV